MLLELGANVLAKTQNHGLTVLHLASATNKNPDIARELLRKGTLVDERDIDGNTPLIHAAICGTNAVIKVLLEHGAAKEVRNLSGQSTPLLHAIIKNHAAAAQFLIENGADLTAESESWCWQAIHEAVRHAVKPVISLLIERGQLEAAVNRPGFSQRHGLRPLHIAVGTMNAEIAKMLVGAGPDLEARTHVLLQTPFLIITEKLAAVNAPAKTDEEMLAMAKLLVSLGADVCATDSAGNNLLFGAASQRAISLFEYLLEQELSIDSEDSQGLTVLHCATIEGKTETISYLLEKGADKSKRTKIGMTALHMAASWGWFDAVKLLAMSRHDELDVLNGSGNAARSCEGKKSGTKEGGDN